MSSIKSKNNSDQPQNLAANKKVGNREAIRECDGESIWRGMLKSNIELAARAPGVDPTGLMIWIKENEKVPPLLLIHYLKLITQFQLDPFNNEISLLHDGKGTSEYFIHITIDGWMKILNSQEQFDGFELEESQELMGIVPTWIACTIYRKDRKVPIRIKEYFSELKTEHEVWTTTPYRMLRNRTIASCARIAFGVADGASNSTAKLTTKDVDSIYTKNNKENCTKRKINK